MDVETYDQIALNADVVGDALKFVKENETVKICSHNGNVFSVEPRFLSSWRLQKQSRDLRAILHREQRNRLL